MSDDSDEDESKALRASVRQELTAQRRRMEAYEGGDYELSDDEGFTCVDCGWKGLSAPLNLESQGEDDSVFTDDDEPVCVCPECGGEAETHDTSEEYLDQFKPPLEEVVDPELDPSVAELREAYASGELTLEEFEEQLPETHDFYDDDVDIPDEADPDT